MLSRALTPPGELQTYIAVQGGAGSLLHDGPFHTQEIEAVIGLAGSDIDEYRFRLLYASDDSLVFADERFKNAAGDISLAVGHREPRRTSRAASTIRDMIVYHFDDVSSHSRLHNRWSVDDGLSLKEDGGNLAPFLYRLREDEPRYYRRIVDTLRLILPFFANFELKPQSGSLLLRWLERGTDRIFSMSQASDGMLRAMALVALLQQPENNLPDVLILDEPELGLHPSAVEVLAALLRSVSHHVQVIVATQSVSLVDRFEPHDIVVVERAGRESRFRRLNDDDLAEWREEYTLSELWEKNVLGDRPALR
jgi:predicted ATPase